MGRVSLQPGICSPKNRRDTLPTSLMEAALSFETVYQTKQCNIFTDTSVKNSYLMFLLHFRSGAATTKFCRNALSSTWTACIPCVYIANRKAARRKRTQSLQAQTSERGFTLREELCNFTLYCCAIKYKSSER